MPDELQQQCEGRVRPVFFRPRESIAGQASSDYRGSETWPDTVALRAKPAIERHTNHLFCCLVDRMPSWLL
jgi:hypothetical protein